MPLLQTSPACIQKDILLPKRVVPVPFVRHFFILNISWPYIFGQLTCQFIASYFFCPVTLMISIVGAMIVENSVIQQDVN